ncbi:MAG TPA: DNA topoisomerase IB [Polyangiaceae bacterium]|nr:DNA topoisomerase IB [Polyangiaceae bacterium]
MRIRATVGKLETIVTDLVQLGGDPVQSASTAGLRYVADLASCACIRRVRVGKGFRFIDAHGRKVTDEAELRRVRALAIPPAWTDVRICTRADGHIQATGRDAKGRKQYRYHARWRQVRDETKFGRMIAFAEALPAIRTRVAKDAAVPGLPREKVLAVVTQLLERTLIRVGNEEYAKQNRSYGLTTLRGKHVDVAGPKISFRFRGKSGKDHVIDVKDRRLATVVRRCQELPGQELFQFIGEDGQAHGIESADVNAYLREAAGEDFSAKDFRTWYGTLLAARALGERVSGGAPKQKHVVAAVAWVAEKLGNTPTVCRKSYVHPAVISRYLGGKLEGISRPSAATAEHNDGKLDADERALLALLKEELIRPSPSLEATLRASVRRLSSKRSRSAAKGVRRRAA